jgi:L-2-hydroxyglutarate oxidase LhgO
MDHIEIIIIGAGVVGLAIARSLTQQRREVLILEREAACGTINSSRNSGIIHAGVYYQPGSLKARLCVEGREKLYAYAADRGIPHKRCGKLIVATDESQINPLRAWQHIAEQNGLSGLLWLSPAEARSIEPEVFCTAALHVPMTGIIDVHPYLQALEAEVENAGGMIALRTSVTGGEIHSDKFILTTAGVTPSQISCTYLINSAGLGAQEFSRHLSGLDANTVPPLILAKGNYFSLSGTQPFAIPVYPLPVLGSSGLHAFCDMAGRVHFGPDVEWIDEIDFSVDPNRVSQFEASVRRYWPALPSGVLQPDYCGIRPKIASASPHDTDFLVHDFHTHKIPKLINLYGIESPGLTSSLALGDYIAGLVKSET